MLGIKGKLGKSPKYLISQARDLIVLDTQREERKQMKLGRQSNTNQQVEDPMDASNASTSRETRSNRFGGKDTGTRLLDVGDSGSQNSC